MRHFIIQLFAIVWCTLCAMPIAAQNCQIDTAPPSTPAYDPSQAYRAPFVVVLRVRAIGDCAARLQVDQLDGAGELKLLGNDSSALRASLSLDAAGTVPLQAAPYDVASWRLLAGQSTAFVVWVNPMPQQWVRAGLYQAPLRLRLLDAMGATLDVRDWMLSLQVQATTKVAFTGAGNQSSRLDFGEISAGARRTASLDVWANAPYQIRLSSQNRGFLHNKTIKAATDSRIGYTVNLAGQTLSLAGGGESIAIGQSGNARYPLEVTLGVAQRLLAGEYADDLLITITAQ